jgi:hypothetical protein
VVRLTVWFDGEFRIGVGERVRDGEIFVVRHVFGPEPGDQAIYQFVMQGLWPLFRTCGAAAVHDAPPAPANPKRRQRLASRAVRSRGVATRSQEALRAALEAGKREDKLGGRARRRAEQQLRWEQAVLKRKRRKRGR